MNELEFAEAMMGNQTFLYQGKSGKPVSVWVKSYNAVSMEAKIYPVINMGETVTAEKGKALTDAGFSFHSTLENGIQCDPLVVKFDPDRFSPEEENSE